MSTKTVLPSRLVLSAGALLALLPVLPVRAADPPKPGPRVPMAARPHPSGAPAAAPAPTPGEPKPFDEVIKDAEKIPGLYNLYRTKKNEVYLEVTPEMLEKPYFLEITAATGLGGREGGATTGDPLYDVLFQWKKVREQVFLTVKQTNFRAKAGDPIEKSIQRSFGDSVLAAFKVESQPQAERKSVLVNCTSLFFMDLPALSQKLTQKFQSPFSMDREKSYVDMVKSFPQNAEVEVSYSMAAARPVNGNTLADGHSAQLRVRYSFIQPKDSDYQPRVYDNRVGYFVNSFRDLTDDDPKDAYTRWIYRWDVQKQDPNAAMSPAKKPIVFWVDNAVPMRYRKAVTDGLLMWNKAFEKIGIKDAVQVKQIPDGAEIDPFDIRYNVLRWATSPDDGYAVALFRVSPVTGEIYNASIRVDASIVGLTRKSFRLEEDLRGFTGAAEKPDFSKLRSCEYPRLAAEEMAVAMSALELAQGPDTLTPSERERFTKEYITEVVAHEMGHIMGLRHNFKASTLNPVADLQNVEKTSKLGLAGSVMDYNPPNLAAPGEKQGEFFMTTLGPYDFWAIQYGYERWPGANTPDAEKPHLAKIASRAAEPGLAYATDEDTVDIGYSPLAVDPTISRFDFSADPLAFAKRRAAMLRTYEKKLETKNPTPGESFQDYREKFQRFYKAYLNAFRVPAKYIGGVYTTRAHQGDPGAPLAPMQVVPAAKQREALKFIQSGLFGVDAFKFSPVLINRLAADRNLDWGTKESMDALTTYSPSREAAAMQRSILAWIFHPGVLSRVEDNENRVAKPSDTLSLTELFGTTTDAIFTELRDAKKPVAVQALRRELQRDYLGTLIGLYEGSNGSPADAQSLARLNLRKISSQITAALNREPAKIDTATRAHLEQAQERIQRVLKAQTVVPG